MSTVDNIQVPLFETASPGYEVDFCAWSNEQARRLRAMRIPGLDIENVAEEIESLGRSDKRELRSRMIVLLAHLLKWSAQPELSGRSWRATIGVQRRQIAILLDDSPSLRPLLKQVMVDEYGRAVATAVRETGLFAESFPAGCVWTADEVLGDDFFPAAA